MPGDSLADFLTDQSSYRRAFVEANGSGPWPCHFCAEPVSAGDRGLSRTSIVIHHLDEDRGNDDLANLAPAHHGCHVRHHVRHRNLLAQDSADWIECRHLAAALLARGWTSDATGEAVGRTGRQIRRWKRDPDFRALMDRATALLSRA